MRYILILLILSMFGCTQKVGVNPPDPIYSGVMFGGYSLSFHWVMACNEVRMCVGSTGDSFPRIRIYPSGTTFKCGGYGDAEGCYRLFGRIDVPENASTWLIKHECVHHWLKQSTGDVDQKHKSEFFETCT